MKEPITIHVSLDAKTFRDFAMFDTFRYHRRWVSPAIFAVILFAFSMLCFAMRGTRPQAALIGVVLLVVGLGLPLVYFIMFLDSVKKQSKKYKLDKPQSVYTLSFSNDQEGVAIEEKGQDSVHYRWDTLHQAFRTKSAMYLYVAQNRAYILPVQQLGTEAEMLWTLLSTRVGKGKRQ